MFAFQKTSASRTHLGARAIAVTALALAVLATGATGASAAAASPGATTAPAAAQTQSGLLTLTTQRAVVFKDGYALLIKKATGTADAAGRVFTLDVPDAAVLGSFWAVSPDEAILAMRAEYTDDWKRVDAILGPAADTLDNLLKTVIGKAAALTTADGKTVRGKVLGQAVLEGRPFLLIEPETGAGGPAGAGARPVSIALADIVAVRSPDLAEAAKPNPAFVSSPAFNPKPVEEEIARYLDACRRYGTICEFVLKDISTIANNPSNLTQWAATVNRVLDRYYR